MEKLLTFFRTVAHDLFGGACDTSYPRRILKHLVAPGGMYDYASFEETLRLHFGQESRMFDCEGPETSGTKIAVTATKVGRVATPTRIFTNYNGVKQRRSDNGKHDAS